MNRFQVLLLLLVVSELLLDVLADFLNLRQMRPEAPREFRDLYDAEKYRRSQQYQGDSTRFAMTSRLFVGAALIGFLLAGGFDWADQLALGLSSRLSAPWATGLLFVALLGAFRAALALPFSVYATFVLEARYGFNRTTPRTFVGDLIRGLVLAVALGAPVFAGLQYFFEQAGERAWVYSWIAVGFFQVLLAFLAPVLLMPLFNRFWPLAEGELKQAIDRYAEGQDFRLNGVYLMDGSRRSSKANAFFTGFGRFRRLVLFDTLVEKHSVPELVAVVAHEVGHFKLGHILKSILLSLGSTGVLLYGVSALITRPALFEAFGMSQPSIHAGIVLVSILYGPVLRFAAVATHALSRRFEYEADEFAARTFGAPESLVTALKKLSVDSMSNLTPHRLKVALDYSHPPILSRIEELRRKGSGPGRVELGAAAQ